MENNYKKICFLIRLNLSGVISIGSNHIFGYASKNLRATGYR